MGRQTTVALSTTAIFSVFVAISSETSEIRQTLLYRYAVPWIISRRISETVQDRTKVTIND